MLRIHTPSWTARVGASMWVVYKQHRHQPAAEVGDEPGKKRSDGEEKDERAKARNARGAPAALSPAHCLPPDNER